MAKWLRRVTASLDSSRVLKLWDGFQQGAETLCHPLAILRGLEPVSALTRARLYRCALYDFSLLNFVSGDLALTRF